MKDYTKLKEFSANKTNEYSLLQLEHQQEIERLKLEYEKLLNEKNAQTRLEYENQLRELKEKLNEKDDLDRSTSSGKHEYHCVVRNWQILIESLADFSKSSDLGQRLRDQVNLTKELDNRLITDSMRLAEFKKNAIKSNETKQLPESIKVSLRKKFESKKKVQFYVLLLEIAKQD